MSLFGTVCHMKLVMLVLRMPFNLNASLVVLMLDARGLFSLSFPFASSLLGCIKCMRCRILLPMIAVSVRQSVCHAAQLGFTVQKWLNESRCCLGWTLLGPMQHCVRWGSWSPYSLCENAQILAFNTTKFDKRRSFEQGCEIWGSRTQIVTFWSYSPPPEKRRFGGHFLTGHIFSMLGIEMEGSSLVGMN